MREMTNVLVYWLKLEENIIDGSKSLGIIICCLATKEVLQIYELRDTEYNSADMNESQGDQVLLMNLLGTARNFICTE